MKNEKGLIKNEQVSYSDREEYRLAGRYVKRFLEVRTEGRRAHSWDHTLLTVNQALESLNGYDEIEGSSVSEDEEFSVYIASLIHDVIQPDDIMNRELAAQMKEVWGLDESGNEFSEGVKAFNYFLTEIQKKLSSDKVSDNQRLLGEKLAANRDLILKIYSEKSKKDLTNWANMDRGSRALTIADVRGNWNPDAVVKLAGAFCYFDSKKEESKRMGQDGVVKKLLKTMDNLTVRNVDDTGVHRPQFYYDFFHNEEIIQDLQKISPETVSDFWTSIEQMKALSKEKEILDANPVLKSICGDNGIGIYGMVSFWYGNEAKNLKSTSQELFDLYMNFLAQRKTVEEIAKDNNLSENDTNILLELEQSSIKAVEDIKRFQENFVKAENSLGIGL